MWFVPYIKREVWAGPSRPIRRIAPQKSPVWKRPVWLVPSQAIETGEAPGRVTRRAHPQRPPLYSRPQWITPLIPTEQALAIVTYSKQKGQLPQRQKPIWVPVWYPNKSVTLMVVSPVVAFLETLLGHISVITRPSNLGPLDETISRKSTVAGGGPFWLFYPREGPLEDKPRLSHQGPLDTE